MVYVVGSSLAPGEIFTMDMGGPIHDKVAGRAVPVADQISADPMLLEQGEQFVAALLWVNLVAECSR